MPVILRENRCPRCKSFVREGEGCTRCFDMAMNRIWFPYQTITRTGVNKSAIRSIPDYLRAVEEGSG